MSADLLYLVTLDFQPDVVGGASLQLQLAVDPIHQTLSGIAKGRIQEGTQHAPSFTARVSGTMHGTGLGKVTMVGGVQGQAAVSFPPPAIGTYLAPLTAGFAVDGQWNGTGTFSLGGSTYRCKVTNASLVPA